MTLFDSVNTAKKFANDLIKKLKRQKIDSFWTFKVILWDWIAVLKTKINK